MSHPTLHRLARTVGILCLVMVMAGCGPSRDELSEQAEYHYKLASNFFYEKNPQSALEELYATLEFNETHAKAHHLMGFIYFGRRDHVRALKHLQLSVALDPEFDTAYANLGNLYLAMEEWDGACEIFQALLDRPLYRTPHLAHNNLGWAKFNQSKLDEAQHHYETAVFLNPKMCLAYNNVGRLHAQLGRTDQALEAFHEAIELCESYQEPHYFLGRIYRALSAPDRARKHFQRCVDLGKGTPYGRRCREAF
jgi:tetratricopeptide (TPR) repeat protein